MNSENANWPVQCPGASRSIFHLSRNDDAIRLTSASAISTRWKIERLAPGHCRSEEHTSELQSRPHLVCRLLLEKKKKVLRPLCTLKQNSKDIYDKILRIAAG